MAGINIERDRDRRVAKPFLNDLRMDASLEDIELVAHANPATWQTPAALGRRLNSPSMTPWRWKRFARGIWTDVEEPWINEAEWDACAGALNLDLAPHCTLGVDIGQVFDSSAVAFVGFHGGGAPCAKGRDASRAEQDHPCRGRRGVACRRAGPGDQDPLVDSL
jgi:hypothetical protein